jgi:hypothetical protein
VPISNELPSSWWSPEIGLHLLLCAHIINVEEIYDEPDAVYGMFLLNKFSTLILFDTGASHSFISRAFVVKTKIPTETIGCPIRVSSPGGELIVNADCRDLVLEIGKHKFPANLIED